jgi:single-strand selective monofunctional uracil DNA glycosylase
MTLLDAARQLRDEVADYPRRAPLGKAAYVLNPLGYAWRLHAQYAGRFAPAGHTVEAVFLGMNPGPWGMGQTGVPFGSPDLVREFLALDESVDPPARTHPKRPILGLDSARGEVSGRRLWGAIRDCFGEPGAFFERFYVVNYCPLLFQSETGANLTPDKLPARDMEAALAASDRHLSRVLEALRPRTLIGVGAWAEKRARKVIDAAGFDIATGRVLHPSPASPAANRGWKEQALRQLEALGHPWPA